MDKEENDSSLCRLCTIRIESGDEHGSIFNSIGDSDFATFCMTFARVQIADDDDLPKFICPVCRDQLMSLHEFKLKCEQSEVILQDLCRISEKCADAETSNETVVTEHQISDEREDSEAEPAANTKKNRESSAKVDDSKVKLRKMCEQCGLSFSSNSTLRRHLVLHTGQKDFKCEICDNKFARKFHLDMHMRTHLQIRPHKCETCDYSFATSSDLTRHRRIHDDAKNYDCSVCGRKFKRSSDVVKHMRSHTGQKPYQCKSCAKKYLAHSGLMKHLRRYHPEIVAEKVRQTRDKKARERELLAKIAEENEQKITFNDLYCS